MKKTLLFTILILCSLSLCQAQQLLTLGEAESIVEAYYSSLGLIVSDPRGDGSINGQKLAYAAIGSDRNGQPIGGEITVPNDLAALKGDRSASNVRLGNYIVDLRQLAVDRSLRMNYKIVKCEYLVGPEMKKGQNEPMFARVVVEKQFSAKDLRSTTLRDTLSLDTRTHGITQLSNIYRQRASAFDALTTVSEMLVAAANLYADKRYDEAFAMYDRVLRREPTNPEASFNLGTMCFKGQGCKQYPRKVRDYMAEFYWQKSSRGLEVLSAYSYNSSVDHDYWFMLRRIVFPEYSYSDGFYKYQSSTPFRYSSYSKLETTPFVCNRMLIVDGKTYRFGYMNTDGKISVAQEYIYAYPFFSNGTALVCSESGQWMLIDTSEYVLSTYKNVWPTRYFICAEKWSDQYAGVFNRQTGEIVMPFSQYTNASPFYLWIYGSGDGAFMLSHVQSNGKYGLFATGYGEILPCKYDKLIRVSTVEKFMVFLANYDKTALDDLTKKYRKMEYIPLKEIYTLDAVVIIVGLYEDKNDMIVVSTHRFGKIIDRQEFFKK